MGDQQVGAESVLTGDGITVYQTFTEEQFGVPSVALKLESKWDSPVDIRIEETLPAEVEVDAIGFHPEYEKESWSVSGRTLIFEAEIGPGKELTTIYAIDTEQDIGTEGGLHIESFFENLRIAEVTPIENLNQDEEQSGTEEKRRPQETSKTSEGARSGVQKQEPEASKEEGKKSEIKKAIQPVESPDRPGKSVTTSDDSATATESTIQEENNAATTEERRPIEDENDTRGDDEFQTETTQERGENKPQTSGTEERKHPQTQATKEAAEGDSEDADREVPEPEGTQDLTEIPTEQLLAELQERLNEGALSDEEQTQIQEAFEKSLDGNTASLDVQISHLQKRVSEMEAFIDSMEQFHELFGPPTEAFGEMEENIDAVTADVDEINETVTKINDQMEALEPRISSIEKNVDEVEDEVTATTNEVESLQATQQSLKSEISELREWQDNVKQLMEAFGGE